MKHIPLNKGKCAIVDDEDYDYLMRWKWRCQKHGRTFRAIRTSRTSDGLSRRTTILMHRTIMKAKTGQDIDHRNHNDLDNRRDNLRFCKGGQNCQNAQKRQNCSSQYKGVYHHSQIKRWVGQITINGNMIYLGCFVNEIDAAKAYDEKAHKLFGNFAYCNFKELR